KISEISTLITPNKREAEILSGISIKDDKDFENALKIMRNFCKNIVIKNEGEDYCLINDRFFSLKTKKIDIQTHGSGCTFSSALISYLIYGHNIEEAVKKAKEFTYNSIKNSIFKEKKLKILNPFYEIEKAIVKENIKRALEILNKSKNKEKICPEVGINIAEITNFSNNVGEFSGRIFYDSKEDKFIPVGEIEFNLGKHLSRALIAYKKYSKKEMNAVINIKFSEENLEKIKNKNFEISFFERKYEKEKEIEGNTMEYGIREALKKNENAEVIYDKGDVGKEAMIRFFGKNSIDVANKILEIFG
ncbi:MAG: PfkB family carbohydrate kinase, partial [Candidatus Altarchaeaceae archaeon]